MRKIGLVTFCATTCVLVPAALHHLVAGQAQLAKLGDPDLDRFTLGGAKISVALDRYILDPGETLNVHIAAANAPAGTLELGVLVMGSTGTEGSRVPSPPVGIAVKTVKLDVANGVGQTAIAIPLEGAQAHLYEPFGHYQVVVGPKATIAKLDRLRRRARVLDIPGEEIPGYNNAGDEFFVAHDAIRNGDETFDEEGSATRISPFTADQVAFVQAHVRPTNDAIALAIPPTATVTEAFTATVTVTNPSRRSMSGLEVKLLEHQGLGEGMYDVASRLTIEPELTTIGLAPGEVRRLDFTVTGAAAGVVGLLAQASCNYELAEAKKCRDVQALQLGTFDATELQTREDTTRVVTAAISGPSGSR